MTSSDHPAPALARATIKRGKAKPFWSGNPLVFSGAIERIEGNPDPGTLISVCDQGSQHIGFGVFNPHSQYRVRMLALACEKIDVSSIAAIVAHRLTDARALRLALGLPSADTNAFRLLNSEGDRCSGLTVDWYAGTAVVSSSALWVEQQRSMITAALTEALAPCHVVWRQIHSPLVHDGWTEFETKTPDSISHPVTARENGIDFHMDLAKGQKTGFYCDQRDNRMMIRDIARGRRVLDLYCYTGGFALNAARGGAAYVRGIDTSEPAIACARENAEKNGITTAAFDVGDAHEALSMAKDFDFIILDPPKLAATQEHAQRALKHYRSLAHAALSALPHGGLLLLCSCSAALSAMDLASAVRDAALDTGTCATILRVTHHAPDHPVLPAFPEGAYLSAVLVRV